MLKYLPFNKWFSLVNDSTWFYKNSIYFSDIKLMEYEESKKEVNVIFMF